MWMNQTNLMASIGLFLAGFSGVAAAQVDILGTGAPCNFSDIASAIAAASPGDTILVEEGTTLFENIGVINKDITIRAGIPGCAGVSNPASPNAYIDGNHLDRVATISATVTLRQVTIMNGEAGERGGGLLVTAAGDLTLWDAAVSLNIGGGLLRMKANKGIKSVIRIFPNQWITACVQN